MSWYVNSEPNSSDLIAMLTLVTFGTMGWPFNVVAGVTLVFTAYRYREYKRYSLVFFLVGIVELATFLKRVLT